MSALADALPAPIARRASRWRTRPRAGWLARSRAVLLLGAVAGLLVLGVGLVPTVFPISTLMVPLLVGSLTLNPRQLVWFVGWVALMIGVALALQAEITPRVLGAVGIQWTMCAIVLVTALRRSRLGVAGMTGESMLVDLRDRLLSQGGIPPLPAAWYAESALRSASGTRFAGDFVVAARVEEDDRLEVVLVDVSGKGDQAGTRALQLSGAFGGMLSALPPDRFLAEANDYLVRQGWEEGFATAVHLSLELGTGRATVRSAGHPPPALRSGGSGKWQVLPAEGVALGLLPGVEFPGVDAVLGAHDTLLLYTDGMVERPRRDLDLGVDRMLGVAERALQRCPEGAAGGLVESVGSRDDDRAVVLLARR